MTELVAGVASALAASLVTFYLTRHAQLSDRRERRAELVEEKRERRLDSIEDKVDDIGDDLYTGFAQLSAAVPGFTFRPPARRPRRGSRGD